MNKWKLYLNGRLLSEGCDFKWHKDEYITFRYSLGVNTELEVKGPNAFRQVLYIGNTPARTLVKIPGAKDISTPANDVSKPKSSMPVSSFSKAPTKLKPVRFQAEPLIKPDLKPKAKPVNINQDEAEVYLDYKKLKAGEDYEWLDSKCIKFFIPARSKCSVVIIRDKNNKQYYEVGKKPRDFLLILNK